MYQLPVQRTVVILGAIVVWKDAFCAQNQHNFDMVAERSQKIPKVSVHTELSPFPSCYCLLSQCRLVTPALDKEQKLLCSAMSTTMTVFHTFLSGLATTTLFIK